MMEVVPLRILIEQLQRLPGIGAKGAQRLAFHLLRESRDDVEALIDAIRAVKEQITYCSVCHNITDRDPCYYCTDDTRDRSVICVVEDPHNVPAVEKTREFNGIEIDICSSDWSHGVEEASKEFKPIDFLELTEIISETIPRAGNKII